MSLQTRLRVSAIVCAYNEEKLLESSPPFALRADACAGRSDRRQQRKHRSDPRGS